MTPRAPTALIADDEPLLRESLARQLSQAWPELRIVAQARNGREAIEFFEAQRPDVCFLDVQMPGTSGIDVARNIGRRAHVVFVTAHDQYAVAAFAQGVLDYLVKPVELERLEEAVARLRERLHVAQPAGDTDHALRLLADQLARLRGDPRPAGLRWIRAQSGTKLELIPVDQVDYLRSDAKYTRVAWHDDAGAPREALVRVSLKELIPQLDPNQFAQVHRAVVVNLHAVHHVVRGDDAAEIHLKARKELLPVSRSYLHLFRQM